MPSWIRPFGLVTIFLSLFVVADSRLRAQTDFGIDPDTFVSTEAADAWQAWVSAMQAALLRDQDTMAVAFEQLLAYDPSPLRLALFADRTVKNTREGGGVLMLEQDLEAGALEGAARTIAERLVEGRERMNQADDGFYFASIGQFNIANANFTALLEAGPDPTALLEFVDRQPRRREVMVLLADHPVVGASLAQLSELLLAGERRIQADPQRIRQNIDRLAGAPRSFRLAVDQLRQSGEYAVPFLIQTLSDESRSDLSRQILRALPEIGRPAVNPLVMALRSRDPLVQAQVAEALGKIGYAHAAPYLVELRTAESVSSAVREAALNGLGNLELSQLGMNTGMSPAEAFLQLAEAYFEDAATVAADKRFALASVWYWREGLLINVDVPTPIFNEVMAMRCCEEALRHDPRSRQAIALWIAANIRREAELPPDTTDDTRPEDFPAALYFAQSAGAEYCLMALDRAIGNTDATVALGVIEALRRTAGRESLLGSEGRISPLAQALAFPDRMVRIHAAFALAGALPDEPFAGGENLVPVLGEAVGVFAGQLQALVIAPDDAANELAAGLRALGWNVLTAGRVLPGLESARQSGAGADAIFVSSTLDDLGVLDALRDIRADFQFAATPLFIIARPGDAETVDAAQRAMPNVSAVSPSAAGDALAAALGTAAQGAGRPMLTAEVGNALALEGAALLAELGRVAPHVFDLTRVQSTLLVALETGDAGLKVAAGDALAATPSSEAQQALAAAAMDGGLDEAVRLSMFGALAQSARTHGNKLDDGQIEALTALAESDPNLTLRTAASQALGALNLSANPASQIIRNLYEG